jgi:hypothetical protein
LGDAGTNGGRFGRPLFFCAAQAVRLAAPGFRLAP